MQKQNQSFDPSDPERASNIMTLDGMPIENSTPDQLAEERRLLATRRKKIPAKPGA